jgi:mannitol-1-/sugar-/sorbitol-6-phosphatase
MGKAGYSRVNSRHAEFGSEHARILRTPVSFYFLAWRASILGGPQADARVPALLDAHLLCLIMLEISCRGLLFDLDGVLVDSTPAVARVWTKWALAHGFDPGETVRNAHGRPSLSTIKELLPSARDPVAENEIILRGEIEDTEGVVALPGVCDFLKSIPKDLWALVTSCARPLADVRLTAAGIPIPEKMITADDVQRGKPDPEPYVKGARLLGVPPSECLVFEDAPAGIRAGKSAGARVIALPTTESEKELKSAGADWILARYENLSLASSNGFGLKLRLMV